jgi:hypothetical protein
LPEAQHRATAGMTGVVFILSFVILFLSMPRDLGMFDEGIVLSDAMLVLHGEIVHRDFYSIYGPAQYYVIAALFKLFGKDFIIARLYDLAVRAAIVAMLFYLLRRQCSLLIALVFSAIGGMWLLGIGFYLYPIFPCILLSLISSYVVTSVAEKPVSPAIVGAGACTGLIALFRYDAGFFLLIAHLFSIAVLIALSGHARTRIRLVLTAAVTYAAGTAIVFVPVAIVFLIFSPIEAFFADIIEYPAKYYALMRGLPFPDLLSIDAAAVYLPLLAAGLALSEVIWQAVRRFKSAASPPGHVRDAAFLIVFGTTAVTLFLKGVVRVSAVHMLLGIVPALVVLAILVDLWRQRRSGMRLASAVVLLLALVPAASEAATELHEIRWVSHSSIARWLAVRAGLITLPAAARETCEEGPASGIAKLSPEYSRVATYLGAHTRPDERIFVALDRHDKILVNSIALYFAVGRLPGTHWHEFDPGLQTRADIQTAIISDLQRNQVRWVVRDASFDGANEPNGSARSSGINLLDHYLDKNYRRVASSGKVAIWLANGETPIATGPIERCDAAPVD